MKFVLSYSGGKDSVLALHKMLEAGHEPVGLLIIGRCRKIFWEKSSVPNGP